MSAPRRSWSTAIGFTTIELMIASFLAIIVVLAAGVIVLQSNTSFRLGNDKVVMQGEATRAVEQIARDVRRSRWLGYSSGAPSRLVCYDTFGNQFSVYDWAGAGTKATQNGSPLTDYPCTDLTFDPNADTTTVNIVLELQSKGFDKVKVESKASIRNRRYVIVDSTGAP
jgi:Tfp pilus assembly protein PilW